MGKNVIISTGANNGANNYSPLHMSSNGDDTDFYKQVADLLAAARRHVKRQLDSTIVTVYYEVGRMIVEREQRGKKRAQYGAKLIKGLSEYLTAQYGKGFSVPNLRNIRQFYLVYAPSIKRYTLSSVLEDGQKQQPPTAKSDNLEKHYSLISVFDKNQKRQTLSSQFGLGWSHYQILMRIENGAARNFYEIEAVNQQWSVRQFEYSLYLPDKTLLQSKLAEWIEEFEEAKVLRELANGGGGE